ncbi:anti-sigma factor [Microbacterium sp.]|uniref:anti-sigma factor n=1 Tax=Microbacterium sp. TaxID=51671 RepID=UPI002E34A7E7|nr:anti-sigma factor [Microbacterium sp.]HEX5731011.1 anti-sigma factor [Microbacterium sp.]
MPHIDPERLALFALGEPGATPEESEHLADCAVCVDELAALRHAAVAGRASFDVGELESPPEAVWERIAAELSLGSTPQPEAANVAASTAVRPRRTALRIWALAASFVLLAGIGLGVWALTQRVSLTEVAEATLAAFPDHPDAEGTAIVEERSDGSLELKLRLSADAAPDTVREVWLITADASALVSLGLIEGREQTFSIPADVDLRDYVLVDVSQEPVDGNPDHSGDSIVRGELSFL